MKRLIFFVLLFVYTYCAKAQDEYKTVMLQSIHGLDTTMDVQTLSGLATTFAAVYDYKKDWHPLYYECLAYVKLSEAFQNADQKKAAIDKAAELLENLPADNDEVQVLRALYAMDYLGIDRSAWQKFLPIINEGLSKAESINLDNPRIYYLRGVLKYNMPASMGGGHEEGIKLFRQSLQKYETYKPADDLAPGWGKTDVEKYLAKN